MKSKAEKRADAAVRAQSYSYENSRAKRLGTADEATWKERLAQHLKKIGGKR